MRPRLFTARNFALAFAAALILGAMAVWIKSGMPLPGAGIKSTAGKLVFTSDRGGASDLWMMNGDGTDAVNLTNDAPIDSQPAWDASGTTIAFVSQNRAKKDGENPQIFEMKATPGADVAQVTQTTSSKSAPAFGPDGRIYYLGAGQIFATTADATDSDAVLPNSTERKQYDSIFAAGGFQQAAPAPAGGKLVTVLHTEHEDALLVYDPADDQQALSLVGVADHISFSYQPDGTALAVLNASPPYKTARTLFSKAMESGGTAITPEAQRSIEIAIALIAEPDTIPENVRPPVNPDENYVAKVAPDGSVDLLSTLPFAVDEIRVSPDGALAALVAHQGRGEGVSIVTLNGSAAPRQIFTQAASHCRWSPDGKQVAFVSGDDVYVAATDGSTPPQNVTAGKGHNADPEWSPAKPSK